MSSSRAAAAGSSGGLEPPSVLILTKNEEVNIERCLRSLDFTDDVVVLDSMSDDRTVEIARSFSNVRVYHREFDSETRQRDFGVHEIEFRHPWLYSCDADEVVPPALRDEMLRVINDPGNTSVAFRLRYRNMFMGRWLRHGGIYPVWLIRLFRPDSIRYEEREINVHPIVDGAVGELQGHFVHYSFAKGLEPWFRKHNSYSTHEAHEAVKATRRPMGSYLREMRGGEPLARRRALKNLSFFLPFRNVARFLYMYLFRLGVLDGRAGFHYAALVSIYEYWIEAKVRESTDRWSERTGALADRLLDGERA